MIMSKSDSESTINSSMGDKYSISQLLNTIYLWFGASCLRRCTRGRKKDGVGCDYDDDVKDAEDLNETIDDVWMNRFWNLIIDENSINVNDVDFGVNGNLSNEHGSLKSVNDSTRTLHTMW